MKSDRFIGEIRRHSSDVAIAAALRVAVPQSLGHFILPRNIACLGC
jgi:hypothetical protein